MDVTQRDDEVIEEWKKKLTSIHTTRADMNRLVMNYLEKEGFKEAAEKFRVESGVSASIDLDTIDQRIQIRDHLLNGDISSAVALINEIHPELLDNDNSLYFKLQQQQLIELIRQKELEKALDFAQIQLSERAEEGDVEVLAELERTLALLAFDDPTTSPFGDLLQPAHRYKVASEVNAKILEQENQESVPQITKILKLLAWSQQQLDAKKLNAIDPHLIQNTCMYIDPKTGRYVKPEWKDAPTGDSYRPSYNIGPTIFTPVLLSSAHHGEKVSSGRVIQPMRWGLIPSWHKGGRAAFKAMHNNCRGETISEKSTFSAPFNRGKRCVVIAEGFYEWKTEGKIKHPYLFTMKSDHQDVCKSGDDGQILKTEQQDDKQSHTKQEIKNECEPEIDSSNLESKTSLTVDLKPVKQEVVEEYNNHTDTGEIETADVKSASTKVGVLDLKQENRRDDTAESPSTKQQSHADTGNKAASGRESHFSSPQSLIFMAGIFDVCKEEGGLLYSYSVLTSSAVGAVKDIHHRMPVILKTEEDIDRWLNYQDNPASKVKDLIRSQDCLCSHRVSDKVNNVRYNEPDCVLKLPPETLKPKTMMKNDLRNWFTKKEPQPSSVKRKADSIDMPQQTVKKLK